MIFSPSHLKRVYEFSPGDMVRNSSFYGDVMFGIALDIARDENGIEIVRVLMNNGVIKWYKFYNLVKVEHQ